MSLLTVSSISASYGPVQALFNVSLSIDEGEVLALMGRNGMGKSTTIKSICRLLPVTAGSVSLRGRNLQGMPIHQVAQLGIGLVPEGRRCFGNLSVNENLICSARSGYWTMARVHELFPRLAERHKQLASQLSGGEQQMLAIGRALMTNPQLLILDEATEGLAPFVRREIWDVISHLKQQSAIAILVVDKSIKEMSAVADRVVLLERGSSVFSGGIEELSSDLIHQYLGV